MAPSAWPFEHDVNIDSNLNRLVSMASSPTLQCPPVPHAQKYHVLNTTVKAADLEEGLTVETLAGVPLTVSWRWVFVACLSLSCAPVCESLFCVSRAGSILAPIDSDLSSPCFIPVQIIKKNGGWAVEDVNGRSAKVRSILYTGMCCGMYLL